MEENHDCSDCWIIAVDDRATDIRGTSDLATRQAKCRKQDHPDLAVTIHYGPASARTHYYNGRLQVDITAHLSEVTHIATIVEA